MKFATVLFVLFVGSSTMAQETNSKWAFEYAISTDYTVYQFASKNDVFAYDYYAQSYQVNPNRRTKLNPAASICVEYRWSDRIRMNAGLLYSGRGVKYKNSMSQFSSLQVYNTLTRITDHYYGIPVNASVYWKEYNRVRFYSTLGMDFNFLFLSSTFDRSKIVDFSTNNAAVTTTQGWDFRGLDFLTSQSFNLFSPAVRLSTGVEVDLKSEAKIRVAPTVRYGIRLLRDSFVSHFAHNIGLEFSYVTPLRK